MYRRIHNDLKAARKQFPQLENHQLHTVSLYCGYKMLAHHEALDDAYACAIIGIKIFGDTMLFM